MDHLWLRRSVAFFLLNSVCCSAFSQDDSVSEFLQIGERGYENAFVEHKRSSYGDYLYPNFTDNLFISKRMRALMRPYLLPLDHQLQPVLSMIFSSYRVIKNKESLHKAGFTILFSQKKSQIIVARHQRAPGYLFKIYLSSDHVHRNGMDGWELLTTRCIVAEKIKVLIKKKKLRWFEVADKWLYPLPIRCYGSHYKHEPVILIVKDMNIYDCQSSSKAWRRNSCRELLRELYEILGRGYGSSFLAGNLPYTRTGKFAFIDTEYDKRRIPLSHLKRYFSKHLRPFWNRIARLNQKEENNVPKPVRGLH